MGAHWASEAEASIANHRNGSTIVLVSEMVWFWLLYPPGHLPNARSMSSQYGFGLFQNR
jgi:hypothetical protein